MRVGTKGAGQVTATSFSVPTGRSTAWRIALGGRGIAVADIESRFGEPAIAFSDPSGLDFELIATDRDDRTPWIADDSTPTGDSRPAQRDDHCSRSGSRRSR